MQNVALESRSKDKDALKPITVDGRRAPSY